MDNAELIARLRREAAGHRDHPEGWLSAAALLDEAAAALKAQGVEAERYQWLRRNQCWPDRELDRLRDDGSNATNAELLDDAIDAAIRHGRRA